jgi:predicted amidohydrolase
VRVLITSATIVDGTGAGASPDSCVEIEDHRIVAVHHRPAVTYDRSDLVIDAQGAIVIPGIINHHAHGCTRGPLMISGEPPLTDTRVESNLAVHLAGGTTTLLNVDGYPEIEDAVAFNKRQPINIKLASLHTPAHLEWATNGPFPMGGVADRHHTTVDDMLRDGAVAVGEAGPGIDHHWADHTLIPLAVEQHLGVRIELETARALRATEGDTEEALRILRSLAGDRPDLAKAWDDTRQRVRQWAEYAERALDEAIAASERTGAPLVFHHTPTTFSRLLEGATKLGPQIVAAHSNFQCTTVEDTIARARQLKAKGAWIDVMGGDSFGVKMFQPTPEHTFALISEGLCDAISTDYCGGYWDSLLRVAIEAWRAGAATLERAIELLTGNPSRMFPGLAPDRGEIKAGKVADLVITHPADPARVRAVLISGRPVTIPDLVTVSRPREPIRSAASHRERTQPLDL